MRVLIQAYSESWPSDFERARERISRALGTRAKRIEHIGSTAVPGLAAKPVIDILLEVDDVVSSAIQKELETLGFVLVVDEPGHRMFRPGEGGAHLHLWRTGDPEIERHLLFRDRLRKSAEDRLLYEREKQRLAALEWPAQDDYAQAKSPMIAEIVARARKSGKR